MRLVQWQTRATCSYLAHVAGMWMDGKGRNPLLAHAMELSLFPDKADEELDALRGERTGYVSSPEQARQRAAEHRSQGKPVAGDTLRADESGVVEAATAGDDIVFSELPEGFPEPEQGSYEAFMRTFGCGGNPAPRGPEPG
jgi:hypothetical protein